MNSKAELRARLLAERRSLDRARWLGASEHIRQKAMRMPELLAAERVHCYVSMEREREVCTLELLEWLALERKEVIMPYIERERMLSARYQPGHRFRESRFGPEPDPLIVTGEERFDAVIVPLAGFDRGGGRIGFGKGWYDRFFEELSEKGIHPVRIGLAFSFQEVPSVPGDSWDQRLDFVVTENETVNCLKGRS
jgi:5-formyltetrahydrofolate cyclo-ligase